MAIDTSYTIPGLDPNTAYDIRVRTLGYVKDSPFATTTASTLNITTQTFNIGQNISQDNTGGIGFGAASFGQIDTAFVVGGATAYLRAFSITATAVNVFERVILRTAPTDSGTGAEQAGPELISDWETYAAAIVIEAGGLSLALKGPNHSDNSDQDTTEPYQYDLSATDETTAETFVTAWRALSAAEKAGTTLTLQFQP